MKRTKIAFSVAGLCGLFILGGSACGQTPGAGSESNAGQTIADLGGTTLFGGVRLWATNWEIYSVQTLVVVPNPANPASAVGQGVPVKDVARTKVVPIPFVGVRSGNFVGSASYFPRTGYDSRDSLLGTVSRDEYDVTAGYAVLPSVVLSLGYKHAYQDKISGQFPGTTKIDALLLGASGSVPVADKLSLYGNAAYGFVRINGTGTKDLAGVNSYSGSYRIAEVGISYSAYSGSQGATLKNVSLTFGYRAQILVVKSINLGTVTLDPVPIPIDPQKKDVQTTTDGVVLGIVASF